MPYINTMKTKSSLNVKPNGNAELTLTINGKTVVIEGSPITQADVEKMRAMRKQWLGK